MRSMQDTSTKLIAAVLAVAAMAPASVAGAASPGQDMRSPDARQPGGTQTGEPFAGAEPGAPATAADADTWTTPAILGGGLALLVIASAGVVLYSRRHAAPLAR